MPTPSLTRRSFALSAAAFVPLAFRRLDLPRQAGPGIAHDAEAIHQEVAFSAPPARLYEAIMDERQFAHVTGLPCRIERSEGGAFTLFGGRIIGRTISLVANQRIVQAWRSQGWTDAGWYSLIRFEMKATGGGTNLVFDQTGFPKGEADHLAEGWGQRYWEPLKRFLG